MYLLPFLQKCLENGSKELVYQTARRHVQENLNPDIQYAVPTDLWEMSPS
jgi:hypothetical protein